MKVLVFAVALTAFVAQANAVGYKNAGCWKDKGGAGRAVPQMDGKYPTLKDNYKSRADAIQKCYEVAKKEGLKVFAVQNGGWCAGGKDMEAYKKYGEATNCKDGKGGPAANDVYIIDAPVTAPPANAYDSFIGCWDFMSDYLGWGWKGFQFTSDHGGITKAGRAPKAVVPSDDKTGIFPASEGWFRVGDPRFYYYVGPSPAKDGTMKWFKFGSKDAHCTSENYKGVKNYCKDWGIVKNKRACPKPDVTFAKNKGNTECSNYSAQGCYKGKSFTRNDKKLLVYWRHDITWGSIRSFTKSLVCTCAKAAKAAGVSHYAIHYWGECWAISMDDFAKNNGGDCIRDFGKECNGNDKRMCLADKDFQVYKTA